MDKDKIKIIATIGPATDSQKEIEKMLQEGASIFRLNLSHASSSYVLKVMKILNKAKAKLKKEAVLFLDLPGPKIRTGVLSGGKLEVKAGKIYSFGPRGDISVSAKIVNSINLKEKILLSDGKIELKPLKRSGVNLLVKALNSATLLSRQSVNASGLVYEAKYPTQKDVAGIKFGIRHGIRTFALSFVSNKEDVLRARKAAGKDSVLISKIERKEAVDNFEDIAKASDIVMIARGDLGLNMDIARVPAIQKKLISSANRLSKPVIVATQMLESMTTEIMPTRAEVDDVFTAISEGTDAVMLSEETAIGQHPALAVKMLRHIISLSKITPSTMNYPAIDERDALIDSAVSLIKKTKINDAVVLTKSGRSAFRLARFHLGVRIFAISDSDAVLNALEFGRNIIPVRIKKLGSYPAEPIKRIMSENKLRRLILISGLETSSRSTESIRIIE